MIARERDRVPPGADGRPIDPALRTPPVPRRARTIEIYCETIMREVLVRFTLTGLRKGIFIW
jgi:hypothetical protein